MKRHVSVNIVQTSNNYELAILVYFPIAMMTLTNTT